VKIQPVDLLWLAGSVVMLAWSIRKVNRRFLEGDDSSYIRMSLCGFGLAMFVGGLWAHWMIFSELMPAERFWTAMIVNMPNLFTFCLWGSVAFGWGIARIYRR